jgi:hypothetical protein
MVKRRVSRLVVLVWVLLLLSWLLSSCVDWEEVGEGVAKGQGTVEVELSKQQTAIAEGVATAVNSYEEEREREGQPTCTSAMLPLLVVGLALGVARSRSS